MGIISALFGSPKQNEAAKQEQNLRKIKGQAKVAAKRKAMTIAEMRAKYNQPNSFTNMLPWYELQDDCTMLLDDGFSVGVVLDVVPVATEGRSTEWLQTVRNQLADATADAFDENHDFPWIIQTFTYNDDQMRDKVQILRDYPKKAAKGSEFSESVLDTMEEHLWGISKEGGLFNDEEVLDAPWGGSVRRTRICIYRRLPKGWKSLQNMTPEEELLNVTDKYMNLLREAGVKSRISEPNEVYQWLLSWFNPRPGMTNGNRRRFYDLASYPENGPDEMPYGDDFAESLFYNFPESDAKSNTWKFDGMYHAAVRVNKLRRAPKIGALTGEVATAGERVSCMLDKLPPGSMVATTTIITPQDTVESHITRIQEKSRGDSTDAAYARQDCAIAQELMAHKHRLYRGTVAVYLRAGELKELRQSYNEVRAQLTAAQLQPYALEHDPIALDSYILNMPFVYEPKMDKDFKMTRPIWNTHLASLSGMLGREQGDGNPGLVFFNRGGEMITVDPLGASARSNKHGVILGPTGAGKSALLTYWMMLELAMHGKRTFMIESGNSFGLFADYAESLGIKVNRVQIKPGNGVDLSPFAEVHRLITEKDHDGISEGVIRAHIGPLLSKEGIAVPFNELALEEQERLMGEARLMALAEVRDDDEQETETDSETGPQEDDQRDLLGEAETVALLMITGGEEAELKRIRRADRRLIRDAILEGARIAVAANHTVTTSDVASGFDVLYRDESRPHDVRQKAYEMGQSIRMFTDGFDGECFNRPGQPLDGELEGTWPDADLTILDMGTYARDGYATQLAISYLSAMSRVNSLGEKYQHSGRGITMFNDEAHLFTTNPLLIGYITKAVKQFRKLSVDVWFATQNCADFPDDAKKLLNMVEWWITLVPPADEIEQIARFRPLTDEQKMLMASARKSPRQYTEGVIMGKAVEALFRNVPPSLALSLAGTEGSEKAERGEIMREYGISEVEAAIYVAKKIDHARGIGPEPEPPVRQHRESA